MLLTPMNKKKKKKLGSNYKEAEKEQTGLDLESKFHSIYVHYFPYEIALLDLGLCN